MNAFLNAENFSQNDLQALLFKPINLFGYRFLVNVVTFLWMYNGLRYSSIELPDSEKPFNFIIIGGGTAGSILAARLSEYEHFRILLIEAGGTESQLSEVPYLNHIWKDSKLDWKIRSEPQENACLGFENQRCALSSGKGLGGSSLIYGMTYVRGHSPDFDGWEQKYGVKNWTSSDLFPYFMKSEDFTDILENDFSSSYHRLGGPLPVAYEKFNPVFLSPFLEAAKMRGYSIGDYNGATQLRFNRVQSIKSQGRRVTTKRAYLDAAKSRRNLHVVTFAVVTRILFDSSRRAVGVEYFRENKLYRSLALNEIVISAGALRTPQILLLSGIGHPDHLNRTSIQPIAELPGVGGNLQDHVYSMIHFAVNSTDTLKPSRVNQLNHYLSYRTEGAGPLTSTGECGHGFIRTRRASNSSLGANVKITYLALSPMSFPEEDFWRNAMAFKKAVWNRYFTPYQSEETTSISIGLMRPESRGSVTIKSDNPLDDPVVDIAYYRQVADELVMAEAVRTAIQIGRSHAFEKFSPVLNPNHFPGCESFDLWSEDYIKCYIKHYTIKGDNYVGTCRMGNASDELAVVDDRLNVLGGVRGLRIVDASVIPEIPAGDIFASVVAIAEKAADIIKSDHS